MYVHLSFIKRKHSNTTYRAALDVSYGIFWALYKDIIDTTYGQLLCYDYSIVPAMDRGPWTIKILDLGKHSDWFKDLHIRDGAFPQYHR